MWFVGRTVTKVKNLKYLKKIIWIQTPLQRSFSLNSLLIYLCYGQKANGQRTMKLSLACFVLQRDTRQSCGSSIGSTTDDGVYSRDHRHHPLSGTITFTAPHLFVANTHNIFPLIHTYIHAMSTLRYLYVGHTPQNPVRNAIDVWNIKSHADYVNFMNVLTFSLSKMCHSLDISNFCYVIMVSLNGNRWDVADRILQGICVWLITLFV